MAKVNRSVLKSIVKECLVELLAEGLSNGDSEELNESISLNKRRAPSSRSINKQIKHDLTSNNKKVVNPSFEENTNRVINNATSDPVLASILSDTAKTTLQEQNSADSPNKFTAKSNDTYAKIADESDPMEMFSESASNWAHLAFSDK